MVRKEHKRTAKVMGGVLYTNDASTGAPVGSPSWFTWLATAHSFYYECPAGAFTAVKERRQRGGEYWTAYRRLDGVLHRRYLGKADALTAECLASVAADLQ
jgi:LuxR family transcriptional regulator, maltose regulon positive regulatory protein